jgi:hypothetical protein
LWSAVLATVFSIAYDLGQIAEWLGWLGSEGGPESSSTPLGIVVLLTPSLLLGSSFLALMVAVHHQAPPERRVWSHLAVAFATIYAALISINYYVQLAWVGPRIARGATAGIEPFRFTPFDSFLYAVDIPGLLLHEPGHTRCGTSVYREWHPAGGAELPHRERAIDPLPGPADVRALADLDRRTLGHHVSGSDLVPGPALQARPAA